MYVSCVCPTMGALALTLSMLSISRSYQREKAAYQRAELNSSSMDSFFNKALQSLLMHINCSYCQYFCFQLLPLSCLFLSGDFLIA